MSAQKATNIDDLKLIDIDTDIRTSDSRSNSVHGRAADVPRQVVRRGVPRLAQRRGSRKPRARHGARLARLVRLVTGAARGVRPARERRF